MALEAQKQVELFIDFISSNYTNQISSIIQKGERSIVLDFLELSKYYIELSEQLLAEPEEVLRAAEIALESLDLPIKNVRVRTFNLPKSQLLMIRDIRSDHIGKLYVFEGIVRQSSDVRPQVVSAKFECPACGNTIQILQIDTKFKEPTRCTCSRRGRFKLLSKDLVDAQRLVIEESPESLEGGEQPKRLSVFLREDLVEPKMEKKTTPGSKVRVIGIIKEVPISLKTGAQSVRYDIAVDANYIEPLEQTYEDILINPEDEAEIKRLAKDPMIYEKLKRSIAPIVFGHDDVKEAIVLQLMGGVRKTKEEGTKTRGDMHILLVGDPGSAKSTILMYIARMAPRGRYIAGMSSSGAGLCIAPDSLVLTNPGGIHQIKDIVEENLVRNENMHSNGIWNSTNPYSEKNIFTLDTNLKIKPKQISQLWRIMPPEYMIKLKTSLGNQIIVTPNTKLHTPDLAWKEAIELNVGDCIATSRNLRFKENKDEILTVNLIKSNPVVLGIKDKVKFLVENACRKTGWDKRTLAQNLALPENNLYHHWVNKNARGNIKLRALKLIASYAKIPLDKVIDQNTRFSLYNGKPIAIPKYVNKDLLYLAGLLAGDGDLSKGKNTVCIRFSNSSKVLMKSFIEISKGLFNIKPKISSISSYERPESWRFNSKLVFEILESLGIPNSPKSHRVDMSNILLKLPNKLLSHYLRGYFDTDGGCVERKTKGHYIESNSVSKIFSEKLKLVLLRYSILAKIRERPARPSQKIKSKFNKFTIKIGGKDNIERFRDLIGFNHPEKKQKLARILGKISKPNTNIDIIPNARELIKKIEEDLNVSIIKSARSDSNGISKNYLLSIVPKFKHYQHKNVELLEKLANSDILWDKIKERQVIKNHNYEYVYDLTVEDSHNFIVNGILVHNTATVVKDEFLRGWALEAGAMVLANGGFAMIDELDKMHPEDRTALHEALEQQRITVHKANIQATLKAETTVLAAANPKLGRFDPYQPIASQIDLPPTLINRFDLIFPIKDVPNKDRDDKIASHVLALHQQPETIKSEIPIELMKKYISYVRQKVHPKLSNSAVDEIKSFYVNLRNSNQGTTGDEIKPIPISARQLEALVRLSEGSARVRMSEKVNRDDAKRAISLLKNCLMQVGFDQETNQFDIDKLSTGITTAQRSKIVLIREIINDLEKKLGKSIPIQEIINEANNHGIDESKVEEVIDKMKREGSVFEPKHGFLSKI